MKKRKGENENIKREWYNKLKKKRENTKEIEKYHTWKDIIIVKAFQNPKDKGETFYEFFY